MKIVLFFWFIVISSFGQNDTLFLTQDYKFTTKDKALFKYVRTQINDSLYKHQEYFNYKRDNHNLRRVYFSSDLNGTELLSTYKKYYNNGKLRKIKDLNSSDTLSILYHLSGKVKTIKFADSIYHFFDNGNLKSQEYYVNNQKINQLNYYNNKVLQSNFKFKNDSLQGIFTEYYDDKSIKIRGFYNKGFLQDSLISYHRNGKIASKIYYDKGRIINYQCFSVDGNLLNKDIHPNRGFLQNEFSYRRKILKYINKFKRSVGKKYKGNFSIDLKYSITESGKLKLNYLYTESPFVYEKEMKRVFSKELFFKKSYRFNLPYQINFKRTYKFTNLANQINYY